MDWVNDYAVVGEGDVDRVFSFDPQLTTVVRLLNRDETPIISSLGKEDWYTWMENEIPPLDGDLSGLILILARRAGSTIQALPRAVNVDADEWLQHLDRQIQCTGTGPNPSTMWDTAGNSDLRTLPFSKKVFLDLAKKTYIHNSILRTVSRTDVPAFFNAEVEMDLGIGDEAPAYVYNCRSSNAWPMDLALAATHIPSCNLTFAVVFGCSISVEQTIIMRLNGAISEASHPLLMPGIFVELERLRHLRIIDKSVVAIEKRITSLAYTSLEMEVMESCQRDKENQEKRDQWLDTTYLRNGLTSWNEQIKTMVSHMNELIDGKVPLCTVLHPPTGARHKGRQDEGDPDIRRLNRISIKIRNRVSEIIKEYEDKIRDCTMRVDGMAMATQWAQGETNVDIALATSKDSRHMRSIALVTMIFLPGTFFAVSYYQSFFSMTFFNWFDADGNAEVSSYLWIYIVVSTVFTFLTIGIWWCFGVWRRSPLRRNGRDVKKELLFM